MRREKICLFMSLFVSLIIFDSSMSLAQNEDSASGNTLSVKVTNVANDKGRVGCSLFWKNLGFPYKQRRALRRTWAPIKNGAAICLFKRTGLGEYAVFAFHDKNNNGKLDSKVILTDEGWGVSQNIRPRCLGCRMRFKDAKFKYEGGPMQIQISLVND